MEANGINENEFPPEAKEEIKKTTGWIMFMGVLTLVGAFFGIIGQLTALSVQMNSANLLQLVLTGVSVYVGILLLQQSASLKKFVQMGNQNDLFLALKSATNYFMIAVIMIAVNIIVSIVIR